MYTHFSRTRFNISVMCYSREPEQGMYFNQCLHNGISVSPPEKQPHGQERTCIESSFSSVCTAKMLGYSSLTVGCARRRTVSNAFNIIYRYHSVRLKMNHINKKRYETLFSVVLFNAVYDHL